MKAKLLPDVEELNKMFYIDSSIPNGLRWKSATNKQTRRIMVGDPAGSDRGNNYMFTKINGTLFGNHRIIYSIFHNVNLISDQIIDHQDRNPQNNHPNNLRIVTISENSQNRTKRKQTSSNYVGVYFNKRDKQFQARIGVNKKFIYLGSFLSELEAARAYNNYIISHNLSHFNLNDLT